MKKFIRITTGVNIIIGIILVNVLLSFYPFLRVDLSKDKIHSLSLASKETLKKLDDVVNVKVFMTNDLPAEVKPLANNLKTILGELQNVNSAKFKVTFIDPSKNSEAKTEAEQLGIQPLQFSSIKSDKYEVQNGYFGLAMYYADKKVALPVANDVGNLEYFLMSGVKKLISKETPAVIVVNQSSASTEGSGIEFLKKYLSENYEVTYPSINSDEKLNDKAEVMVLIEGDQKLEEKGLTKVKDWMNKNKGLIVFYNKVMIGQGMQGQSFEDKGLEELIRSKGFEVEPKLMLDESSAIASFRTQNGIFPTQYPYWVLIRPENVNSKIPAMSGLSSLTLPWTSPLKLSDGAEELFSSSQYSLADDNLSDLSPLSKKNFDKSQLKKYSLGGINRNNSNKIAVIGNSSFINDQFVSYSQQNLAMALNLVDYFSQDPTLLSIRSKTLKDAPLNIVDDKEKTISKSVIIGSPVLILLLIAVIFRTVYSKKNNKWYEKVN